MVKLGPTFRPLPCNWWQAMQSRASNKIFPTRVRPAGVLFPAHPDLPVHKHLRHVLRHRLGFFVGKIKDRHGNGDRSAWSTAFSEKLFNHARADLVALEGDVARLRIARPPEMLWQKGSGSDGPTRRNRPGDRKNTSRFLGTSYNREETCSEVRLNSAMVNASASLSFRRKSDHGSGLSAGLVQHALQPGRLFCVEPSGSAWPRSRIPCFLGLLQDPARAIRFRDRRQRLRLGEQGLRLQVFP